MGLCDKSVVANSHDTICLVAQMQPYKTVDQVLIQQPRHGHTLTNWQIIPSHRLFGVGIYNELRVMSAISTKKIKRKNMSNNQFHFIKYNFIAVNVNGRHIFVSENSKLKLENARCSSRSLVKHKYNQTNWLATPKIIAGSIEWTVDSMIIWSEQQ